MSTYNAITTLKIIDVIKKYKYFTTNLGHLGSYFDDTNKHIIGDKFIYNYNATFKTQIHKCGNIGDISFFIDYQLKKDTMNIYKDNKGYVFNFDYKIAETKGVGTYVGSFLKEIEENAIDLDENKLTETKKTAIGDPDKLFTNPGQVRWEDVVAYRKAMRK